LIAQALDAGAPCAWVLADALSGSDSRLRRMLETREQPYVLAVRSNHCLRFWTEEGLEETTPAAMADALASEAWATHAAGEGAGGSVRERHDQEAPVFAPAEAGKGLPQRHTVLY
jgi:SRSO17 transposase